MSDMTVKDFAVKVGRDVPRLLEQMKEAGLKHASENDAVSEDDKQTLLSFLKKSHGGGDLISLHGLFSERGLLGIEKAVDISGNAG